MSFFRDEVENCTRYKACAQARAVAAHAASAAVHMLRQEPSHGVARRVQVRRASRMRAGPLQLEVQAPVAVCPVRRTVRKMWQPLRVRARVPLRESLVSPPGSPVLPAVCDCPRRLSTMYFVHRPRDGRRTFKAEVRLVCICPVHDYYSFTTIMSCNHHHDQKTLRKCHCNGADDCSGGPIDVQERVCDRCAVKCQYPGCNVKCSPGHGLPCESCKRYDFLCSIHYKHRREDGEDVYRCIDCEGLRS